MRKPRLLLVDDDEVVLATFGTGLRDTGFEVRLAGSGMEALAMARKEPPELAILDVRMPGLSGIETAAVLRETDVPFLFLSAYDERESVEEAVRHGALGYLVKPLQVSQAVPTIKAALERAQEMRELVTKNARLSRAIDTGNLVNVALGILMERHHIGQQDAFELLRDRSRNERRKLRDLAGEVLDAWNLVNDLRPQQRLRSPSQATIPEVGHEGG